MYPTDCTLNIAKQFTHNTYNESLDRAGQLNLGVGKSEGKYVMYLHADMMISEDVLKECINKREKEGYVALYVPKRIVGSGFWTKVRDFERSFHNATCVDTAGFVSRDEFLEIGGYDESLDLRPDDWDFDRRVTG